MTAIATVLLVVVLTCVGAEAAAVDCNSLDFMQNMHWTNWAVANIANLQFTNPNWNSLNFHEYLVQDGFYMREYHTVYHHMHKLCGKRGDALFERLNKTFSLDDYAAFFNITDYDTHAPSALLKNYLKHYAAQESCSGIVSAMLPCLCIYPTIEAKIRTDIGDKINTIDPLAKAWMDYNKSSGTSCKLAQCMRCGFGFFV